MSYYVLSLLLVHFTIVLYTWSVSRFFSFLSNLWMVEWFTRARFRKTRMAFLMPASVAVLVGTFVFR